MPKIVLVGEAYGAKEELFQHPFVGSSGKELATMLYEVGLGPELVPYASELDMLSHWKKVREEYDIDITNVFSCRPQDNKIELFFANAKEGVRTLPPVKPGKYLRADLYPHLETLWRFLEEAKPNLIIALGNTACWAVLGESKITALRGTIKLSPRFGVKVLPTYHPAAILREWKLRPIVLTDLTKAKSEAASSGVTRTERWMTIEPTLEEISEWFQRPAEYYAVDIENPYRKQISMIGFARSPADALVVPFADETKPGGSYWPTVEEEIAAWRLVATALASPVPKIFQNGVYDVTHLLNAGFRPANLIGDTMLYHHALYPEMLKGLGFLGSIYSSEIAWKPMGRKGNNLKRDE